MKSLFDVTDFGASGVAVAGEPLVLKVLQHVDWNYPPSSVVVYRAAPGTKEYDSAGIQRAIDAAHAAGGGTVWVPAGDYLIGPIQLRSRVNLHLAPGARLWGSPVLEDYYRPPIQEMDFISNIGPGTSDLIGDGSRRPINRLVVAIHAEDVSITGQGQISGQGPAFFIPWMNRERQGPLHRPVEMFVFKNCRNVKVQDLRIVDTTYWTLLFEDCDGVKVRGVSIRHFDGPNADGIDVSASSNVAISDCDLHVSDDAICLKNVRADYTVRNVTVSNCVIRTICNAVKIGTDTWGDFEDIAVSNLVISNREGDVCDAEGGINLNSVDGGSVRRVSINNVTMKNVRCPIYLMMGKRSQYQGKVRTPQVGRLEDIVISHVTAENARYTSFVMGHPENPARRIRLTDIQIRKGRGFAAQPRKEPVPELPEVYPHPRQFGELPSHGFYARHVRELHLCAARFLTTDPDARPPVVMEDVTEES